MICLTKKTDEDHNDSNDEKIDADDVFGDIGNDEAAKSDKDSICLVSNKIVGDEICKRQVHAFCGTPDEKKGYGCLITCQIFVSKDAHKSIFNLAKRKNDAQAERMVKRTKSW